MKAYCLHTVHYVKEGEKKVTVAPAGTIADGMSETCFDDLEATGAVRKANPVDEARAAESDPTTQKRGGRPKATKDAGKSGDELV